MTTTEKNMINLADATSAEKRVMNKVIVTVATSTFTSNVLLYHSPSKLKSMITIPPAFGSWWSSLATSVAKKAICPIFVSNAILKSGYTLPLLLLKLWFCCPPLLWYAPSILWLKNSQSHKKHCGGGWNWNSHWNQALQSWA